jgi:hypothetical protein
MSKEQSKKKQTKIFCTLLSDFFNDIYKSYPDASLLMLIKISDGMILTNPSGVVENFMICVEPFIEKIKAKDEGFFLEGGLSAGIGEEYSFLNDEINKIVNIWKNPATPENTKKSIWKYFEVLVSLGEKLV